MNRKDFLYELRRGLEGLPKGQVADVLADYESHFDEGAAEGRSEDEISAALGDPTRLARELRAEAGFKRWETERTPGSLASAILALLGLATLDIMFMLPFLGTLLAVFVVLGLVAIGIFFAGIILLVIAPFPGVVGVVVDGGFTAMAALALAGVGLIAGGVGAGALFWWALEGIAGLLVRYARLHFRLIDAVSA